MRWPVLFLGLFCLSGCAVQSADPPYIKAEDYCRLPITSLDQLRKEQLVVYLDGEDEVVGVIAQIVRDPSGYMIDPDGRTQNDPMEWVKIWIYDGQRCYRYQIDERNLSSVYQMLYKGG